MNIMQDVDGSESIVISYKMININTFNIFVIDLEHDRLIQYWHESYQLWESPIKGFLLSTNEFMVLFKDGINLIAVGTQKSRVIKDKEGLRRQLHSLGSKEYLKIEPSNHLLYACQYYEDRQLCI